MAKQDDETTGFCCCALLAVGVVVTVVGWIVDFVGNHPVWTAVIVLALVGLSILVFVAARSDSSEHAPPARGVTAASPTRPSRPPRTEPFGWDARAKVAPAAPPTSANGPRSPIDPDHHAEMPPSEGPPAPSMAQPTSPDRDDHDELAPGPVHAGDHRVCTEEPPTDTPAPIMAPEAFKTAAKGLLRRDQWAILGASFTSADGGIDMIAAREVPASSPFNAMPPHPMAPSTSPPSVGSSPRPSTCTASTKSCSSPRCRFRNRCRRPQGPTRSGSTWSMDENSWSGAKAVAISNPCGG